MGLLFAFVCGAILSQATARATETPPNLGGMWGSYGSTPGKFAGPRAVALDQEGSVYVGDPRGYRIQKFTKDGAYLAEFGELGAGPGQISSIVDIAIDSRGRLFLTDYARVQVFSTDGTYLDTWVSGETPSGRLRDGGGLALDSEGFLYVTDSGNERVLEFDPYGLLIYSFGDSGSAPGQLIGPTDVAVDTAGYLYVLDSGNKRITKFTDHGDFVLSWGTPGTLPGQFVQPLSIDIDGKGNLYIADAGTHRIQKFSPGGELLTAWGELGTWPGQFNVPTGIAVDNCSIFITDYYNYRVQRFDYPPPDFLAIYDPGVGTKLVARWKLCRSMPALQTQAYLSDRPGGQSNELWMSSPVFPATDRDEFAYVFDNLTPYQGYYMSFRFDCGDGQGWRDPVTPDPDEPIKPTYPLVLAHGLDSGPVIWESLIDGFDAAGFPYLWAPELLKLGAPGETNFSINAWVLSKYIEEQIEELEKDNLTWAGVPIPVTTFDIVAHSMGGLIARRYIAGRDSWAMTQMGRQVRNLVTLGTPNDGVRSSEQACDLLQEYPEFGALSVFCELSARSMIKFNRDYQDIGTTRLFSVAGSAGRADQACGAVNEANPVSLQILTVPEECPNDGVVEENSAFGTNVLYPRALHRVSLNHYELSSSPVVLEWIMGILAGTLPLSGEAGSGLAPAEVAAPLAVSATSPIAAERYAVLLPGGIIADSCVVTAPGALAVYGVASSDPPLIWATSPGGVEYRSDSIPPDSSAVAFSDEARFGLLVSSAEPGRWSIRLENAISDTAIGACYGIAALDGVELECTLSPRTLILGDSLLIVAEFRDAGGTIQGATVTATVFIDSRGMVGTMTLADNGVPPDAHADDGEYTAGWVNNFPGGGAEIRITASGTAHTGQPVKRVETLSVLCVGGATPVGLTVFASWTGSAVEVSWAPPGGQGVSDFEVQRAEKETGEVVLLRNIDIQPRNTLFALRDGMVEPGRTYSYTVVMSERGVPIARAEAVVRIPQTPNTLFPNWPNPFKTLTRIPFVLARESQVRLEILDIQGRLVSILLDKKLGGGIHIQEWDGRDGRGSRVQNGLYFYRLTINGGQRLVHKALLLR